MEKSAYVGMKMELELEIEQLTTIHNTKLLCLCLLN